MEEGAPLLGVTGLVRRFGQRAVLDGVSLTVLAGAALALVGPNGSGKTTLLRCLVGVDRPDEGEVRLDGRPCDETQPWVRRAVASVLDDVDFFPDLSAGEHLGLLARAHAMPHPDAVVDAVLDELRLSGAAGQLPGTLSSGQRRRLALASCLVRPRRLLVLDEPEQRLDADGRAWLATRLRGERERGVGVVLASHDAALVSAVRADVLELGAP